MTRPPIRVACYCRVSTKKGEQLESLSKQIEFFEELTQQKSYELYKIYADEGISGKQLKNRKQFQEMMREARLKKFDTILVKDITRFSRNVVDFLTSIRELKLLGINVLFTSFGMDIREGDEAYLTILATMAEDESRRLSAKIKFGKNITAKKGRVPNFVFGYDKVDRYTLLPNPEESEVVKQIFDLYVNKKYGAARIAEILTQNKVKTKKDKQTGWSQRVVIDILRNNIYIGKVINKKSEIVDFITGTRKLLDEEYWMVVDKPEFRIIDDEIFEQAQLLLQQKVNSFKLTNKRESHKYLFSNLIKCSECGYSFRRCKRQYSPSGKTYVWWTCSYRNAHGKDSCINYTKVDEDDLRDALLVFLSNISNNRKILTKTISSMVKARIEQSISPSESPVDIQKQINKLSTEKEKYMDMYKNDIINMNELKEYTQHISEQIQSLKQKLSYLQSNYIFDSEDIEKIVNKYFDNLQEMVDQKNFDNVLLKKNIDQILVKPDGTIDIQLKLDSEGKLTTCIPLEIMEIDLPTHLESTVHKDVTKWNGILLIS